MFLIFLGTKNYFSYSQTLEGLKRDNNRLREENLSLIRVISRLSGECHCYFRGHCPSSLSWSSKTVLKCRVDLEKLEH